MSITKLIMPDANTDTYVRGFKCPSCGSSSVFLGAGNYLTCGSIECPNPDVADAVNDLAKSDQEVK
jgi:hypothetical protein